MILVEKHPNWSKKSRSQRRIALDYSNPRDLNLESLILTNVNIKSIWVSGCMYSVSMIMELCDDFSLSAMEENGVSLKCPLEKDNYVGLNTAEIDWSIIETEAEVYNQMIIRMMRYST